MAYNLTPEDMLAKHGDIIVSNVAFSKWHKGRRWSVYVIWNIYKENERFW